MLKLCESCKNIYNTKIVINFETKYTSTTKRKFCFECSPFGTKDKRHPKDRIKDLDGCRTCTKCRKRKKLDNDNFSKSKNDKNGFRWLCRVCASKNTIAKQKAKKQKYIDYKGGKCEKCGYDRCNGALHFHHRNPKEKSFTLGKYRSRTWDTVKKELDKCILLCANCHAEEHEKIFIANS